MNSADFFLNLKLKVGRDYAKEPLASQRTLRVRKWRFPSRRRLPQRLIFYFGEECREIEEVLLIT